MRILKEEIEKAEGPYNDRLMVERVSRFAPSVRIGVNFVCFNADNQIFEGII